MATTVTVDLKDFDKELDKFTGVSLEKLREGIIIGLYRSIPDLVAQSPVDTGAYAQSWGVNVGEKSASIGNSAPHAAIIETGARPFTPPIAPLLAWAKRVLRDPSQPPEYSDRVWALARGTQQKIAKFGMQPRHVLKNALPGILENIKKELKL